jgi:hypothetical protein
VEKLKKWEYEEDKGKEGYRDTEEHDLKIWKRKVR